MHQSIQWWPGDDRIQGISSHALYLPAQKYSSSSTRSVNMDIDMGSTIKYWRGPFVIGVGGNNMYNIEKFDIWLWW